MSRWADLATVMGRGLRPWQILYMFVFAVFATVSNLDTSVAAVWIGQLYILLSVGALGVLLPHFRRVLFLNSDPLRYAHLTDRPLAKWGWRLYLYVGYPVAAVGFLQLFSAVTGAFLQFSQSNVSPNPTAADYVVAVLAGLEELWRWSMVGTVIVVCRFVLHFVWHHDGVRTFAFFMAFVLSSLSFGAGHILEFQSHRFRAWMLFSLLGAVLALFTIVTGRIVLTMIIHTLYDLWVTWLSSPAANNAIAMQIFVILLIVVVITVMYRKSIFRQRPRW